jgi:SAM-dependent methyltransferase
MTISGNTTNWRDHWDKGVTGWDLGGPHPLFSVLLKELESRVSWNQLQHWYVPGCGRAHDAAALANKGANVLATDYVDLAVIEARKQYQNQSGLRLAVADALAVDSKEIAAFDAVFDRAMLCAMTGFARAKYIEACRVRLRKDGYFVSIPFAQVLVPEGPPFQMTEQELREAFGEGWEIQLLTRRSDGAVGQRITEEILFIARKL